ncbi:hypothetical protein BO78DRAFT_394865 [Aspergillus sclerotiicarbonarius CBS 121057]|uniref:Uncharacterized protein n=1 Tax=Aspergillus sclerotiicarbonarius (strain CBS 121057 / IBT 28362) TaxID=1448318 RepID=A0A319EXY4_ASPSB|nr:hypothetical protein BO78DRAFT_394865 [Aspergillus sclerotiicarbonarius CBS 121057]
MPTNELRATDSVRVFPAQRAIAPIIQRGGTTRTSPPGQLPIDEISGPRVSAAPGSTMDQAPPDPADVLLT